MIAEVRRSDHWNPTRGGTRDRRTLCTREAETRKAPGPPKRSRRRAQDFLVHVPNDVDDEVRRCGTDTVGDLHACRRSSTATWVPTATSWPAAFQLMLLVAGCAAGRAVDRQEATRGVRVGDRQRDDGCRSTRGQGEDLGRRRLECVARGQADRTGFTWLDLRTGGVTRVVDTQRGRQQVCLAGGGRTSRQLAADRAGREVGRVHVDVEVGRVATISSARAQVQMVTQPDALFAPRFGRRRRDDDDRAADTRCAAVNVSQQSATPVRLLYDRSKHAEQPLTGSAGIRGDERERGAIRYHRGRRSA